MPEMEKEKFTDKRQLWRCPFHGLIEPGMHDDEGWPDAYNNADCPAMTDKGSPCCEPLEGPIPYVRANEAESKLASLEKWMDEFDAWLCFRGEYPTIEVVPAIEFEQAQTERHRISVKTDAAIRQLLASRDKANEQLEEVAVERDRAEGKLEAIAKQIRHEGEWGFSAVKEIRRILSDPAEDNK